MASEKLIDISCKIVMDDPRKAAIAITDGTPDKDNRNKLKWFWLPRSLTEIIDDNTVTIPEWLAYDKELI